MKEKLFMWLAWKLPRKLVYWASIRLIATATQGEYSTTAVPELTAMDALKRWEQTNDWGLEMILHWLGFHRWSSWQDYIIVYGIVFSQTRVCFICNKREERRCHDCT